jgi:hypothetical protein
MSVPSFVAWLITASALTAAPAEQRTLVLRLVEQLAAPKLADRQEAARQLESLGPDILPLLPDSTSVSATAVRDAIDQLRPRLERRLAEESTRATTVTVTGPMTLAELTTQLSDQTGNAFDIQPQFEESTVYPVEWKMVPYWTAVGDLEQRTNRRLMWRSVDERFALVPVTSDKDLARSVSGPFRIVVHKVEPRQTDETTLLRFHCGLQAEPRLQPLFVQWPLRSWELVTKGTRQPAWNPDAVYELPFNEGRREVALAINFPATIEPPAAWTLTGKCIVHLAAGREPLVFSGSQLRRGATVRRGGVTAQIRSAKFDPADSDQLAATVRVFVNYDRGGPVFESHRLGLFHRSAWLESDAGQRVSYARLEIIAEADGGLAVEYQFPALKPPATSYRFVYEAPTLLLEVPVEVRLSTAN